mgnify:CR=1 FL=1
MRQSGDLLPQHLAIMVGLPQSGKSTKAKTLRNGYFYSILCPDEFRQALHGHEFFGPAEGFVWASVELAAQALINNGHSVLIDACNQNRERREPWVRMARKNNLPLVAYPIYTSRDECAERAIANGKVYLEPVIQRMYEASESPTDAEDIVVVKGWGWDGSW